MLIGVELLVARHRHQRLYRLNDAVNDLSCGILQQLLAVASRGFVLAGFVALHGRFRLFDLPDGSALTWAACFVGVDFLYYWFHRLSHEVNFLWAAHVVHHQSEDYNLAVALRQSAIQPFFSMVFYWPLALLGFPPLVFATSAAFNTLYQFWIHTRTIDRLGPLERVLMTPSHHRVHHGRNPLYIDRNHGGTFIVWDKLFGTFEEEREAVAYGITRPLASWNPLWANLHYWVELVGIARRARRWRDRLQVFLRAPGWRPAELGGPQTPPPVGAPVTFDPAYPARVATWSLLQFGQLLLLSTLVLFTSDRLGTPELLLAAAGIAWGLVDLGALFEGRPWAGRAEWLRLLATPLLGLALVPSGAGALLALLSAANLLAAVRLGIRWSPPGEALETSAGAVPAQPASRSAGWFARSHATVSRSVSRGSRDT